MLSNSSLFESAKIDIIKRYADQGSTVQVESFFPYGTTDKIDTNNKKEMVNLATMQLDFIIQDLKEKGYFYYLSPSYLYIKSTYQSGKIVIIGHSGGGVSGFRASEKLNNDDKILVHEMVQVGSPRVESTNRHVINQTTFLSAYNDPISILGIWTEGYEPLPEKSFTVFLEQLANGAAAHTSYFSNKPWAIAPSISNLSVTLDKIWENIK
ncbi:hypothetical protein [Brevibacillus daliensis]|uniref:hypothetical protein n=1 Tax=Brevibacillus daliensis TaxID=2892995 RepID=UPI001E3852DA|nr:hypothetical protein [Brevibacillus daliensis]